MGLLLRSTWAATLLLLLSCSTVNQRIRARPDVFDQLSTQEKQLIRRGEIARGFTEEMVYLAKGDPDSRHSQYKDGKIKALWTYSRRSLSAAPGSYTGTESVSSPFGIPATGPNPYQPQPVVYENRISLIVEFEDGKVVSFTEPHSPSGTAHE